MSINEVGLLSPGDMGHVVGSVLIENGMPVVTCLDGRSQRTRMLSEKAGIRPVDTYEQLVRETDMILSILKEKFGLSEAHADALLAAADAELKGSIDYWQFAGGMKMPIAACYESEVDLPNDKSPSPSLPRLRNAFRGNCRARA